MGICSSLDSTSVVAVITAKLIFQDGQLQEFSTPVKASHVLKRIDPPCFICDADEMDFGGFVTAVNGDDDIRLGQLYFVLPLSWLNKRLRPDEMAGLAVRANKALGNMRRKKSSKSRCCGKGVDNQVVFSTTKELRPSRMVASEGFGGTRPEPVRKRGGTGRGRGGRGYTAMTKLSVITEDEDR